MNTISQNAINLAINCLIKPFEGCKLSPYLDCVGIPTIGIGNTIHQDGSKVTLADKPITQKQADELCEWHLSTNVIPSLQSLLTPLNDQQNGALMSLVYNIGAKAFTTSTLYKLLNSGITNAMITKESWLDWNKARIEGILKSVQGLTNRRICEWNVFSMSLALDENTTVGYL